MGVSMFGEQAARVGRWVNDIEETFIALILGLMTILTFANVVARYVFNSNILWALETTVFLFAWLVLVGASYCVKTRAHLGVDLLVNILPAVFARAVAILAILACIAFSVLLLIGSWDYWAPFVGKRAWYQVDDIVMPEFLQFLSTWLNEGERYDKLPRFIPYFGLPLGVALLTLRFLQAAWQVFTGKQLLVIASHEAEEMLHEVSTPESGGH
ncbi:MAG: TRAP transporter small permease [Alphaproteobacteria bacterium]|jgi:C4-dicarboxylate transporter, DctQ subunit|nr:TRAP transporter small permease [Alphaproteobacteria bacterium]